MVNYFISIIWEVLNLTLKKKYIKLILKFNLEEAVYFSLVWTVFSFIIRNLERRKSCNFMFSAVYIWRN